MLYCVYEEYFSKTKLFCSIFIRRVNNMAKIQLKVIAIFKMHRIQLLELLKDSVLITLRLVHHHFHAYTLTFI
jgi:hypothetical protein